MARNRPPRVLPQTPNREIVSPPLSTWRGDHLASRLFIFAAAITAGALGVSQAGWTGNLVVYGLFSLAALLALAGFAWAPISRHAPRVSRFLLDVSREKLSWFALLVVFACGSMILDYQSRTTSGTSSGSGSSSSDTPVVSLAKSLSYTSAHVRMKFGSDGGVPVVVGPQENIWGWYSLSNQVNLTLVDGQKMPIRIWNLFMVFDKNLAIRDIQIDGNGSSVPPYEIKRIDPKFAVILFSGDMSNILLDIKTVY